MPISSSDGWYSVLGVCLSRIHKIAVEHLLNVTSPDASLSMLESPRIGVVPKLTLHPEGGWHNKTLNFLDSNAIIYSRRQHSVLCFLVKFAGLSEHVSRISIEQ